MQLTKGAIGNLINRYKAVLKKCHLLNVFGSLAVAGMLVMGGAAAAGAAVDWGTENQPATKGYTWQGEETVTHTGDIFIDTKNARAFQAYQDGPYSGHTPIHTAEKGTLVLGSDSATISISSSGTTGESYGVLIFDNSPAAHSEQLKLDLKGDTVSINAVNTGGYAGALHVSSDVITSDAEKNNTVNITSTHGTTIYAQGATGATAIEAMSGGILTISGPLTAKAELADGSLGDVIYARGNASVTIGASSETVKLDGNINFGYTKPTSGTAVDASINLTLSGKDSYWNGNTMISWDTKPEDSKLTVSGMTLALKDGATWTPTIITTTGNQQYTSLNNLTLDNGNIDVNKGIEIVIDKIAGTGFLDNEGTVTLASGKLNGKTSNNGVINLDPGASISNVTFEQGGADSSKALIAVEADRTTLNGGMATGEDASASVADVAVTNDKNVTIDGIAFKGNTFKVSQNNPIIGTVTANLGSDQSLSITGSNFENNAVVLNGKGSSGSSGGAAVSVKGQGTDSKLTITGSTFSGNRYEDTKNAANGAYGGAIGVQNASVTLTGVTLTSNSANSGKQVQGGAYYQSKGTLDATLLTVKENTVTTSSPLMGAGMALWGTSGSITNGSEISNNSATVTGSSAYGGGLYLRGSRWGGDSNLQFAISDTTFSGNSLTATGGAYGGGLYVKGDTANSNNPAEDDLGDKNGMIKVALTDVTFSGNTVSGTTASQGGALYILGAEDNGNSVPANATLTVTNGTFTNNKAEGANGWGGAIYNAGTLTVEDSQFTGNEAGKYGGAIAGDVEGAGQLTITNSTFTDNKSGSGGAIALWSDGIKDAAKHAITGRFEGNMAERKGGAIAFLANHSGDNRVTASISGEFLNNSAGESGGAIHSERAALTITDATFTGNTAGENGGAIYNEGTLAFTGTNTFSGNMAAGQANDIHNAGSIIVADGTTTLGSGLTQIGGNITVSGGTLDMASGSSLSFDENSTLTINGGTFVADFDQLLTDYATTNKDNGITDGTSIIGTAGNLNLRLDGGYYTLEDYNAAKDALLGQGEENAALNFLNASLKLDDDQALVVGAEVTDDNVTITMPPVVAGVGEAPEDAIAEGAIPSVPNQIVSVVEADDADKNLLKADTITVQDSEFTAQGLQIAGTKEAEAVTLDVTAGSNVTLTGGEAGFTGVVNAEGNAVATNVKVEGDAALTVGLEGNANAQNLVLNEVEVADGTFAVAGNGLDTTQVAANTLTVTKESATVAVDNASLTVENAVVEDGLLNITNTVADLGTVEATGGVLFFDPSYGTIKSLANNELGSKLLVSDGSVVNVAFNLEDLQEMARKAGFTTTPIASDKFTLGGGQSMLAVGQPIQLIPGGQIVVDANVDATGAIGGSPVPEAAYFGADSLLVVNGNTLNGATAAITLDASNSNLNVENGAKLFIADAVAGQTYTVITGETNTNTAFNGGAYNSDTSTGWKGDNLLTSSDMLTLTSTDGTEFTAKSEDAHTVFPNLSHELATAVNTLYGQKINDVDADAMGVRFLSRATDNRFLGADKDAAAATIESAARIAFAGAVPQMTKMASDAATNAVVNRLGFANPADGAQAMNAEGQIVDRNTTGFALWIAPLWQSQHGWGMEAGNLDYGFNGNLGGVSLGADYTFENAIRAGITFNIGGGYAESSGGDLNSTENRMSFWGLGAYAGWNYENFGLMADVSYTSTWNDLKQDMDSRMGMGDLEADVQASAISAGLRAEYKLETSVLDVIPHIGVRYMSLNTWGFDAESNGGTVLEGDGFHQDIWTFPVGVTFTKDFTLDSGWSFKPSIDFSVIPAAGDIKAKQDVAFTGLPGSYEVETQMMDYLTWQGGVGLEMGNDTMSFGVNYTLQAGQHTTGHGVFGSFRYEF